MEKIFAEMFAKQPDKIERGDYFYRMPWNERENSASAVANRYGMSEAEYLERWEKHSKATFNSRWEKRTFQGEFDEDNDYLWVKNLKGKDKNAKFEEVINKIAYESIPFMDIASSEDMGLASYILKLNPKTQCLITDIDAHAMNRLRSRIDESLPEYHISVASFDNLDMPLGDDSIDCVTSIDAITNSYMKSSLIDSKTETSPYGFGNACIRKLISEVYRILKPGGIFITAEGIWHWEYDLQKIDAYFGEHEKLYGLYTRERVLERIAEYEVQDEKLGLCDEKFTAAGFEVEFEKRYRKKLGLDIVLESLSPTGELEVIVDECDRTEDIITIYLQSILYILHKPT